MEKVELVQNLARENIQRSQEKMKEYYDRSASQPLSKLDNVFGFTHQKRRGVYQRSYCVIFLLRIELSYSHLRFIIVCVLKTARVLTPFMLIE